MGITLFCDRASTSAMEAALSIVFNKPAIELSAQMVVGCANSQIIPGPQFAKDNGCYMGDATDAIMFMSMFSLALVCCHLLPYFKIQKVALCVFPYYECDVTVSLSVITFA